MLLRRMLIMLGVVLAVVLALAAYKGFSIYQQIQMFSAPQPAISVSAAVAREQPWQSRLPAIGTLKAYQGVDLTAEVQGTVKEVLFQSGEKVTLGQPLLQLDSEVERAILATAEAVRALARVEYQRGQDLIKRQAISKSEFDRLNAELLKAEASVTQLKAELDKKRILAPFAGTIGIRQVDTGDYLSPGTSFATLQDLSRLYVDFFLPEQDYPQLAIGQSVRLSLAAYPGEVFSGEISALNPKVEETTRNVQVRAMLPNPDNKLLPGMFANLEVLLPGEKPQVLVPETAITYTLYGNSVYVIGEQKDDQGAVVKDDKGQPRLVVERRFVETGERRDGQVLVLKGLKAGEQVVTAGQLKLDNGAHVAIVEDQAQVLK
ncbi:efflux RND transporter periplasmic adaptor subunit [Aquipseudomonas alcaligenes]|jgi:membrane fusion protein (multidrug efflux system)|uniref:Efflux RND transporter periplasmic adaptor subunit n=1 Tax=Aquipseudomonas alcaligenes TaxID=43263 RepID=A0AA42SR71_AQUAC|nr:MULTISPECIES: efflux RND transporter periplasmic adaptor subunit [Pseudomonas]MDH1053699.1 efflux RND transporter periplasmic adaptor subunit [Pseudomonas alcaligenes]MEE1948604.1 efflux RND transporter periplasmic adaptor subunit [Pseudomonas alcaligenes]BCR23543.1 resistance-nodulation-cell division efflux membrane fusion protein [Pseudomonas alcaligenes]GIZ64994.1 resistance-nodulation-cell division efflux membrane fusion protein [Pseudomonas alcaligenes]GIZ69681.1 resistance-nodulation-